MKLDREAVSRYQGKIFRDVRLKLTAYMRRYGSLLRACMSPLQSYVCDMHHHTIRNGAQLLPIRQTVIGVLTVLALVIEFNVRVMLMVEKCESDYTCRYGLSS